MDLLPERNDGGHKGTFGTVVVVGGSATMLGAPCFVATAALRGGAGIVRLAVPEQLVLPALTLVPSAMALPIGADLPRWLSTVSPAAVLALGCGWGESDEHQYHLRALLASPHRLVLDADGLNVLASLPCEVLPRKAPVVLTPHPGEFNRLAQAWDLPPAGDSDGTRVAAATALAAKTRAIVVLKGAGTVVTDATTTTVDPARSATLAIPGSGDVLTGLIAALMAQGLEPLPAARLGVRLHGIAGGLWRDSVGPTGLIAMDLADLIPQAFQHYRRLPRQGAS